MIEAALAVSNDLHIRGRTYKNFSEALSCPEKEKMLSELILHLAEDVNYLSRPSNQSELQKGETFLNISVEIQGLAKEYTRLFRGPVKALVYPYESMHINGEVFGASTHDIMKLYTEAGLMVSPAFKDLPDHICAELEFVYFLCARQEESLHRDNAGESSRFWGIQKVFFERHLGCWGPQFCLSLNENTIEPYFKFISRFMTAFLESEKQTLNMNSS